ncbi:MAG: ATP-binding protein, partial [Betaproteobacteria bacterium]
MRIRSHLTLLAAGAMVPVLAFAVLLSAVLLKQDNAMVQRGALDRARAMTSAVDAMLDGAVTTVNALASSSALAADDFASFHAEATRVLATQSAWTDVTLTKPSGEKLVDVSVPYGSPLPPVLDLVSVRVAVESRRPTIGIVSAGRAAMVGVPVRVPVVRDGVVRYVLSAIVRPDYFGELIAQQRLPDGWIGGIVDSSGHFIARVPKRPVGDLASVPFREALLKAPEGWYRGLTVEGRDTYTAHVRSPLTGWGIGLAIPADIVLEGFRKTAWLIGAGVLGSIGVAMFIVGVSGRRIVRPIVSLATVARSVGRGDATATTVSGGVEEVTAVAAALRDADVAVRERQSLIQREKEALQAADRAKDEFIAALSHELRNPLAALTTASHILRTATPTDTAATDARRVVDRQTRHMSRMIEDLLDVSRIIMGKANLVPERLDLADVAFSTVATWRSSGRLAERVVTVGAEPAWVLVDRTRIEQVLANLLDNAVKFTTEHAQIAVGVQRMGDTVALSVTDDGAGLPPELLERVFDVFVQGAQGVGRAKGGIGVGLSLVRRLVELQGGTVDVASDGAGKGAVFTVRLPAVDAPPSTAAPTLAGPPDPRPCRVLLVEDNTDAREMLKQVLEMEGHDVVEAADGLSGVAAGEAHDIDV